MALALAGISFAFQVNFGISRSSSCVPRNLSGTHGVRKLWEYAGVRRGALTDQMGIKRIEVAMFFVYFIRQHASRDIPLLQEGLDS